MSITTHHQRSLQLLAWCTKPTQMHTQKISPNLHSTNNESVSKKWQTRSMSSCQIRLAKPLGSATQPDPCAKLHSHSWQPITMLLGCCESHACFGHAFGTSQQRHTMQSILMLPMVANKALSGFVDIDPFQSQHHEPNLECLDTAGGLNSFINSLCLNFQWAASVPSQGSSDSVLATLHSLAAVKVVQGHEKEFDPWQHR